MTNKALLIGAGGHAGVLYSFFEDQQPGFLAGFVDGDPSKRNALTLPYLGTDDFLARAVKEGFTHFVLGVGSTRANGLRQNLYQLACENGLSPAALIHPSSILSKQATVGKGCHLLARTLVQPGAELGDNVLVNSGAIIEHNCIIDSHVHLAPGAVVCGGVRIGSGSHIGAGAVILQGRQLGQRVLVGAGAVVVHDVPDGKTVKGVPAR
jgi:sugar O-acyltransferase (sialic acid O-acetyltransferase NeuD family)